VLCRRFCGQHPPWKHEHSWMTRQSHRERFRPLYPQPHPVVLDRRDRGVRDARALRQLILTQALELSHNAH